MSKTDPRATLDALLANAQRDALLSVLADPDADPDVLHVAKQRLSTPPRSAAQSAQAAVSDLTPQEQAELLRFLDRVRARHAAERGQGGSSTVIPHRSRTGF